MAERLEAQLALARAAPNGRAGPCDLTKARLITDRAKEVSQPDSYDRPAHTLVNAMALMREVPVVLYPPKDVVRYQTLKISLE